jgi:AcrR family transcriptional regulator
MEGYHDPVTSRRAEYAAATKLAIHAAARDLFLSKGYVATTVDDIAAGARVAPATVYAVGGGKQKLLATVVEEAVSASTGTTIYEQLDGAPDAEALLRLITATTRTKFERWRDVMRVVTATAGHEPAAAQALEAARGAMRHGFERTARRLRELNALRDGLTERRATDLLWFYLGNAAYDTLTQDNGWSLDEAEEWALTTLRRELLG